MSRRSEAPPPDKPQRSKYLQPKQTGRPEPKKLRLTDLCAEEKLKVGELIKLNESRRIAIKELTEQLDEIREKFAECQGKLNDLEQAYQLKEETQTQLREEVELLRQRQRGMEEENRRLAVAERQWREEEERKRGIRREERGVQTERIEQGQQGVQTKKAKTKSREVQAGEERKDRGERETAMMHSRSFDRIHRGKESSAKNSFSRSHHLSMKSHNTSNGKDECEEDEGEGQYRQESEEMEVQQRLNELAKQWLDLKEKKVSNLKAQYESSKAHLTKEDLQTHPKEFTFQEHSHSRQELTKEDIDDNELNHLLKSNNFSASRLLTAKGLLSDSHNSRKASVQLPRQEPKKSPMPYAIKQPKLTLAAKKGDRYEGRCQFYESDFMELVDSLQD